MTFRQTFAKTAACAAALATATMAIAPGVASAQPYRGAPPPVPAYQGQAYDSQNGYYYDGCRRAQNNRSVGGGLAGAAAGAVIGGNVASRNARDEGAILGGLLGAVVGSQVGKSTAACQPNGYTTETRYEERVIPPAPYNDRYADRYDDRYAYGPDQSPGYDSRRDPAREYATPPARPAYDDGCTMVDNSIRMPDGRIQKRLVRVCRDSQGEYQVVD